MGMDNRFTVSKIPEGAAMTTQDVLKELGIKRYKAFVDHRDHSYEEPDGWSYVRLAEDDKGDLIFALDLEKAIDLIPRSKKRSTNNNQGAVMTEPRSLPELKEELMRDGGLSQLQVQHIVREVEALLRHTADKHRLGNGHEHFHISADRCPQCRFVKYIEEDLLGTKKEAK